MAAELARAQHGVVARRQLLDAGVAPHVIDYRVSRGRFHVLYRGVYRVGPLPGRHEREMAGVLACGATAVLSHRSAAILWKLLPRDPEATRVHVSAPGGFRNPGPGVRLHRVRERGHDETTRLSGIPITAPARTLVDLAGSVRPRQLEQAMARAARRGLADTRGIARLLERHPGRAGAPLLRALLDREAGPALSRSEAESRFLALVRRARLPNPESNARLRGFEVDFVWRRARLVVEVDGFAYHSSKSAFEGDRRRDAVLAAAGFRVVRVTWRQLSDEPEALLVRVTRALERG